MSNGNNEFQGMLQSSVQLPAGIERRLALYGIWLKRQVWLLLRRRPRSECGRGAAKPLQEFGELHRQVAAFADLARTLRIGLSAAQLIELVDQELEVGGHELLPEHWVVARTRQIGIGDQDSAHQAKNPLGRPISLAAIRLSFRYGRPRGLA
jgi:hypothetical protein